VKGEGQHLRLSFAASQADLAEGLERIGSFARACARSAMAAVSP
jgi:hypothetical protein